MHPAVRYLYTKNDFQMLHVCIIQCMYIFKAFFPFSYLFLLALYSPFFRVLLHSDSLNNLLRLVITSLQYAFPSLSC